MMLPRFLCRHQSFSKLQQNKCLSSPCKPAHVCASASRRHGGRTTEACAAAFLAASLLLPAGPVLAAEGVTLGAPVVEFDSSALVVPAAQQVQQPAAVQLPAAPIPTAAATAAATSTPPFDVVLLSIIHATDELSRAADGLLELTAAASGASTDTAGAISTNQALTYSASSVSANLLTPVVHQQLQAVSSTDLSSTTSNSSSVSRLMSQQALAVAAEALKLATLLEGQSDGCDPAEQELLQQVAAAARIVSVMAADIVQPALGYGNPGEYSGSSGGSITDITAAAAAEAGEAAGAAAAGGSDGSTFAGLPVLGLEAAGSSAAGA